MGIVPIWGFQLLVGIALAFLFKLNKILVVTAAHISIPPLIPFVLFASHQTGRLFMGKNAQNISFNYELSFETIKTSLTQYLIGACSLALIAGTTFFLLVWFVLIYRTKRKKLRQ